MVKRKEWGYGGALTFLARNVPVAYGEWTGI
jgi:hypothetical protein